VNILAAIDRLHLSHDQTRALASVVASQHRLLATGQESRNATLGRYAEALDNARNAARRGESFDPTVTQQFQTTWRRTRSDAARARSQAIARLADELRRILTTEQSAAAQAMVADQQGRRWGGAAAASGDGQTNLSGPAQEQGPTGGQTGTGGRWARRQMQMADRIRQMSPEAYARARQQMMRRFGSSPQGQAAAQQWTQMMDGVRQMSPEQYAQQRGQIAQSAMQFAQQQRTQAMQQRAAAQGTAVPGDALAAFAERYLIPEEAVEALNARATGGAAIAPAAPVGPEEGPAR
jgi:hypothetical protein